MAAVAAILYLIGYQTRQHLARRFPGSIHLDGMISRLSEAPPGLLNGTIQSMRIKDRINPLACTAALSLIITLGGCSLMPQSQPRSQALPPAASSQPIDSAVPTSELVPVEQITDLPTHAATTTSEPQPAETSILSTSEALTSEPTEAAVVDFQALFDSDAAFEQAEILIKRPGHLSRMTSPFMVIAYVDPLEDRLVQVSLLGEDGRTLAEKKVKIMSFLGLDNGNMITELEYEVEGLSEVGRLEISVTDEFGRVQALNSVDLILLSMGETDRNYTPAVQERIIIQYPMDNYMVQGDTLLVSGLVRTTTEQALSLTLVDEEGRLVGEGSASVVLSDEQDYGLFIGEIPYQVDAPIWVRLSVAIPGTRIPGIEYIKTMETVISP